MVLVVSIYLLLVVALPLALSLVVSYRALHRGPSCPICRGETLRLMGKVLGRLGTGWSPIHRRWCPACGWEGLTKVARMGPDEVERRPHREADAVSELEVRVIQVDGRPWRVQLQCWQYADLWYGRLIFGAPSGRLWPDPGRPLIGTSPDEILTQAMLLPEANLMGRVREVADD
ncbi:MAG TPA: hypothetical protein VNZ57_01070 [Longimicrobiales bacterium]|nr:hypothetical protein [Longimicrobiales bacterium]